MFRSSHFWFLVFGHFWWRSYENTKILHNLCLHFARQDGKDGKREGKNWKKITQLKWPKYQKPKNENMGWTKHLTANPACSKMLTCVKKIKKYLLKTQVHKNMNEPSEKFLPHFDRVEYWANIAQEFCLTNKSTSPSSFNQKLKQRKTSSKLTFWRQ